MNHCFLVQLAGVLEEDADARPRPLGMNVCLCTLKEHTM